MAKLTINKSLLDKEILIERESREETLSQAVYACREVKGLFVIARVNETLIPPEDWHLFKLNAFDHVQLTARPEKGALPYIGAVIGAIITWPTGGWGGAAVYAVLKGAAIGYALGSMADSLLFPPSIPNMPLYTDTGTATANPNYGWDGARLVTQPGGPKTVLYGQHRISGALIMQYVSSDGDYNYLNMLINLGQGEISGIMKVDGSGICVSNTPTGAEVTTDNVGGTWVEDYYASGQDADTGTFSDFPDHSKKLVFNGVMKGAFIERVYPEEGPSYYACKHIYARPILHYKYGGTWYQQNGDYVNLRHDSEIPFTFIVNKTRIEPFPYSNWDITDF
ncbi:MAG: hypothetical protein ABIH39_06205, partial [Candidatus Margulisiibacteriota bacterium]